MFTNNTESDPKSKFQYKSSIENNLRHKTKNRQGSKYKGY